MILLLELLHRLHFSQQVKFISENGDAKIDIEVVKAVLAGMGKEELMKFANDPFWIRLRWALFIFFWLIWAAMLAGAVAIIVMAPKCSAPEPKKLWEESAIVELDASDVFNDDLKVTLNDLKSQHIRAISLSSLVNESANGMYSRNINSKATHIYFTLRYSNLNYINIFTFYGRRAHRF